jgi:hypothetical protein
MPFRKPYFYDRKFGSKTFKYHSAHERKELAKEEAKAMRRKGYEARVAGDYDFGGRGYNVYVRKRRH